MFKLTYRMTRLTIALVINLILSVALAYASDKVMVIDDMDTWSIALRTFVVFIGAAGSAYVSLDLAGACARPVFREPADGKRPSGLLADGMGTLAMVPPTAAETAALAAYLGVQINDGMGTFGGELWGETGTGMTSSLLRPTTLASLRKHSSPNQRGPAQGGGRRRRSSHMKKGAR